MLTTFVDLCFDVILEICDYFSVDELFFSFYPHVLPYIFELLTNSSIHLHLCLTNNNLLTHTLLSLIDINQIISLRLSSCNIPSYAFNTVKTLTLHDVPNMNNDITGPFILPSLQRLILIYSNRFNYLTERLLKLAFSHPTLKYLKLHLSNDCPLTRISPLGRSFTIEQLVLNALCSYLTLIVLLDSLPCLRVLRIRTVMNLEPTIARNQVGVANAVVPPPRFTKHSSLQILDLVWYHPSMAYITALLTGLPHLKQFRLSGVLNSKELNGKLWHNLITKINSNLLRINVNMLIWSGGETEEIKGNFDWDIRFKSMGFKLIPNAQEKELLTLIGDFRRSL